MLMRWDDIMTPCPLAASQPVILSFLWSEYLDYKTLKWENCQKMCIYMNISDYFPLQTKTKYT